jgi:glycosyltransferase involved in cell wall biosynthesis
MIISIIIPTYGRITELNLLLQSIYNSNINIEDFEILIIDQNSGNFLSDLLINYRNKFNLRYFNVEFKGLSKAKNFGVNMANGKYVCFPDDDCKFFPETISNAIELLRNQNAEIIFGKCIDEYGDDSVIKFKKTSQYLSLKNLNGRFVEATLFAEKNVFNNFKFDESLGAGCFHGAEEGFDWLYRVLKSSNFKIIYDPRILFYHPQVIVTKGDLSSIRRVFTYRCGYAKLCFKHGFYLKYFSRLLLVLISLPFFLITNRGKFKFYFSEFLGLLAGFIIN